MTLHGKLVCSSVALFALTACGGGGGGLAAYIANSAEDTVAAAFDAGRTVPGTNARGISKDFGNGLEGTTSLLENSSATLRIVEGDTEDEFELIMTLNGEEVVFTQDDVDNLFGLRISNGGESGNEFSGLFSQSGEIEAEAEGYYIVFQGYTNLTDGEPSQPEDEVFFVIGAETPIEAMSALSEEVFADNLEYFGGGSINIYPSTGFGFDDSGDEGFQIAGRVNGWTRFTADLSAGTVGGVMGNFDSETEEDGLDFVFDSGEGDLTFTELNGQIIFEEAEITGNDFAGEVSAQNFGQCCDAYGVTLTDAFDSADYSGTFYGPEADGLALTLSGSATTGESTVNVIGEAHGDRDTFVPEF